MRALAISLAVSLLAGAAAASGGNSLTLASGSAPTSKIIVDSASWSCDGAACVSSGGKAQPALRACKRVVARLGAVSAFTYQGKSLGETELAECNAAARA
jgi:hypothetical protein